MRVTIISLEKCEATQETIALVQETAEEMSIDLEVEHIVITTEQEARDYRHIGSPTVQVGGLDIEPEARAIRRFGLC